MSYKFEFVIKSSEEEEIMKKNNYKGILLCNGLFMIPRGNKEKEPMLSIDPINNSVHFEKIFTICAKNKL